MSPRRRRAVGNGGGAVVAAQLGGDAVRRAGAHVPELDQVAHRLAGFRNAVAVADVLDDVAGVVDVGGVKREREGLDPVMRRPVDQHQRERNLALIRRVGRQRDAEGAHRAQRSARVIVP